MELCRLLFRAGRSHHLVLLNFHSSHLTARSPIETIELQLQLLKLTTRILPSKVDSLVISVRVFATSSRASKTRYSILPKKRDFHRLVPQATLSLTSPVARVVSQPDRLRDLTPTATSSGQTPLLHHSIPMVIQAQPRVLGLH